MSIALLCLKFTQLLKSINFSLRNIESQTCGIFYGSGWPKAYTAGSCYYTITLPPGKAIRIALMDLDLRDNNLGCNDDENDYFYIRGLLKYWMLIKNKGNNQINLSLFKKFYVKHNSLSVR